MSTLQRLREWLTTLLILLLPFHALFVTFGTKVLFGQDLPPSVILALWKDVLLAVILGLSILEILGASKKFAVDLLDILVGILILLAVVLGFVLHEARGPFLLGFRYDFLPLVAFLLLRRASWSDAFGARLMKGVPIVAGVIALIALVSFFLPLSVFRALGYSSLHSLYVPNGPLAPYQQIGESMIRRVQGTMSGPNQLGIWLLIPLGMLLSSFVVKRGDEKGDSCSRYLRPPDPNRRIVRAGCIPCLLCLLLFLALLLTFSRAAWLAAAVMTAVAFSRRFSAKKFKRFFVWGGLSVVGVFVIAAVIFPQVVFRLSSTRGHLERPIEAIALMAHHPLGMGLGTAGPASNRFNEPCVFLRPQDDPSWAKSQPSLCVFVGPKQVQPTDHVCSCPFLPENWYLQIGVELGVVGMVLFVVLVVMVLRRLGMNNEQWTMDNGSRNYPLSIIHYPFIFAVFLSFLGISIAALFLHAWEDAAVAYAGWILVAAALPVFGCHKNAEAR